MAYDPTVTLTSYILNEFPNNQGYTAANRAALLALSYNAGSPFLTSTFYGLAYTSPAPTSITGLIMAIINTTQYKNLSSNKLLKVYSLGEYCCRLAWQQGGATSGYIRSQKGTLTQVAAAPVPTVQGNDYITASGVTLTWARSAPGTFTLTSDVPLFVAGKFNLVINPNGADKAPQIGVVLFSDTVLDVTTYESEQGAGVTITGAAADALLSNAPYELYIYP